MIRRIVQGLVLLLPVLMRQGLGDILPALKVQGEYRM